MIFSKDQLDRLFECASTFATDNHDDCTIEMRIQLCLMCGDQYCLQTILGDLLNSSHATDRGWFFEKIGYRIPDFLKLQKPDGLPDRIYGSFIVFYS
jgi:hypothetical protein